MIYTNYLQNKILSTNTTSKVLYYGSHTLHSELDIVCATDDYKTALYYASGDSLDTDGYIYLLNPKQFVFYNNKFLSVNKPEILDVIYINNIKQALHSAM